MTRGVSPAIARCELTFRAREPIDFERAQNQHRAYQGLLRDLGLDVREIAADPDLPDCCFVEDAAIVLDDVAIVTSSGAPSRRPEADAVAAALSPFRQVIRMSPPDHLDGGDVLTLGRRLFVGISRRSGPAGIAALATAVQPFDYEVTPVRVHGCLHLKSAITAASESALLVNPEWIDVAPFEEFDLLDVADGEADAANVLRVGNTVIAAEGFPRTADRLRDQGIDVRTVDVSEFLKAEAGVTCKSLVFDAAAFGRARAK
ncbi:MAG TPA: dimethylargininase [Vicinamibacteria bacterium]|nr:dimethylargininase [Vicinamibacteria bacterium]